MGLRQRLDGARLPAWWGRLLQPARHGSSQQCRACNQPRPLRAPASIKSATLRPSRAPR